MKLKIYAINSEDNIDKLSANGAEVVDVEPQDEETSAYTVDVPDDKAEDLMQALFGLTVEEATDNGILEFDADVEDEQKESKQAQEQAIDEADEMVDEGREIIEASDTIVWDAADDFLIEEDSDLEIVDTRSGKMLLSDGYVLGFLFADLADESVADLFDDNEKLAEAAKAALLAEASVAEALASFGFEPYTVELGNDESSELAAKSKVAEIKAEYDSRVVEMKSALEQSLAMAMLSVVKGTDGVACPLKASIVDALEEEGVTEGAEEFVEATVASTIPEFAKKICAKAYDYFGKSTEVRNELAKTIEAATYAKIDRSFRHTDAGSKDAGATE